MERFFHYRGNKCMSFRDASTLVPTRLQSGRNPLLRHTKNTRIRVRRISGYRIKTFRYDGFLLCVIPICPVPTQVGISSGSEKMRCRPKARRHDKEEKVIPAKAGTFLRKRESSFLKHWHGLSNPPDDREWFHSKTYYPPFSKGEEGGFVLLEVFAF